MKARIELKDSAENLSGDEYAKFREWFWEYENEKLDERMEADIHADKLKALADKAKNDFRKGCCSVL